MCAWQRGHRWLTFLRWPMQKGSKQQPATHLRKEGRERRCVRSKFSLFNSKCVSDVSTATGLSWLYFTLDNSGQLKHLKCTHITDSVMSAAQQCLSKISFYHCRFLFGRGRNVLKFNLQLKKRSLSTNQHFWCLSFQVNIIEQKSQVTCEQTRLLA